MSRSEKKEKDPITKYVVEPLTKISKTIVENFKLAFGLESLEKEEEE